MKKKKWKKLNQNMLSTLFPLLSLFIIIYPEVFFFTAMQSLEMLKKIYMVCVSMCGVWLRMIVYLRLFKLNNI